MKYFSAFSEKAVYTQPSLVCVCTLTDKTVFSLFLQKSSRCIAIVERVSPSCVKTDAVSESSSSAKWHAIALASAVILKGSPHVFIFSPLTYCMYTHGTRQQAVLFLCFFIKHPAKSRLDISSRRLLKQRAANFNPVSIQRTCSQCTGPW